MNVTVDMDDLASPSGEPAGWRNAVASDRRPNPERYWRRAPASPAAGCRPRLNCRTQFGVNRHTVRRALEELSRGGLVRVEQGRGSFVAEDVLDYKVEPRTRFSEWIRQHNKEPSGHILQLGRLSAEWRVA